MKGKHIYLFVAFLLPGLIFVFLKFFGRNEFAVAPLYETTLPKSMDGCMDVTLPYRVRDSVMSQLFSDKDSLVVVVFQETSLDGKAQIARVIEETKQDPVQVLVMDNPSQAALSWKKCSFFLTEPFNTVLVDYKGRIRGEYAMGDREEADRLLTEITIILKKY